MNKKFVIIAILALFFEVIFIQNSSYAFTIKSDSTYKNLDFETATKNGKPKLWFAGGNGYEIQLDSINVFHGKNSLRISKVSEGMMAVASFQLPLKSVKGKHILYTGYIKTLMVNKGYAGLWLRMDSNKTAIKLQNMSKYGPKGTTIWTRYSIEMDIDDNADNVVFGVLLVGDGTAWFDSCNIYVDGTLLTKETYKPFVPTKEQYDKIKNNVITLSTVEPNIDKSDLIPLKPIFDKAEIISLGEGTHGTSEFFKMKDRLVRFITSENRDAVFAIEANMPEARLLNEYIQTGKGNAKELLEGLYFWTWNTQEVLDMIEWMKDYNLSGKGNIEFCGFDMQYPAIAAKNVFEFLEKNDTAYIDSVNILYKTIIDSYEKAIKNYQKREQSIIKLWYDAAIVLNNHINANKSNYLKTMDSIIVDIVIQDSKIIIQAAEMFLPGTFVRDRCMAENIIWIKEHIAKDKKLILWAHNGHVGKINKMMGDHLYKKYGNKMFVVGFGYYTGSYTTNGENGLEAYSTDLPEAGSIEWVLHNIGINNLFLNFRSNSNMPEMQWLNDEINFRSVGAVQLDESFAPIILPKVFDGLTFIDESTPSKLLKVYDKK